MDLLERLRDVRCDTKPFVPEHAHCICRLTNAAADEIERLRELLSAYVADETRFNRGEGEPYGSISTETGIRARAAVKQG
jgi:hypothetical protein